MDIDKWEQIKSNIKKQFQIEEEGTEDLMVDTGDGPVKQGTADFIVFDSPLGKIKLRLEKKPMVLDKKFIYSHRAGQAARTEYELSETEFTYKLKALKWLDLDEEWEEIDADKFS